MSADAIGGVGSVGSRSASLREPSLEAEANTDGGNVQGQIGGGEAKGGAYENNQGQEQNGVNASSKTASASVTAPAGDGITSKTEVSGPRADLKAEAGEGGAGFKAGASLGSGSTSLERTDPKRNDDFQVQAGGSVGGGGAPVSAEGKIGDKDNDGNKEIGAKVGVPVPGGSAEVGASAEIPKNVEKGATNAFSKETWDPKQNGVADGVNPEKNGFNETMDPNRNGVAERAKKDGEHADKALNPDKNGAAKFFGTKKD